MTSVGPAAGCKYSFNTSALGPPSLIQASKRESGSDMIVSFGKLKCFVALTTKSNREMKHASWSLLAAPGLELTLFRLGLIQPPVQCKCVTIRCDLKRFKRGVVRFVIKALW